MNGLRSTRLPSIHGETVGKNFKTLSEKELRVIIGPQQYRTVPRHHQLASIAFAKEHGGRCAFFHDIGTGKTLAALYSLGACVSDNPAWCALVVCPPSVLPVWQEEAAKHTAYRTVVLSAETLRRRGQLFDPARIYVVNWEGLQYLYGREKRVDDKTTRVINPWAIKHFMPFDAVIFDEAHHAGNWGALQTQIAYHLSRKARCVLALTGSPGEEQDIWSILMLVDNGRSLGRNFYRFRQIHFNRYQCGNEERSWQEWVLKEGHRERILDDAANAVIRYSMAECEGLPPVTRVVRHVAMSKGQKRILSQFQTKRVAVLPDGRELVNAVAKAPQISGGTVIVEKDKPAYVFRPNPKLAELENLADEIQGKLMVFHAYVAEGDQIERLCHRRRWSFRRLPCSNTGGAIKAFRTDPKVRLLIAQPQSGGEGINIQGACHTIVWYSVGRLVGERLRRQGEGRCIRSGQQWPVSIIDLVGEPAPDADILLALKEKRDVRDAILRYLRGGRGGSKGT